MGMLAWLWTLEWPTSLQPSDPGLTWLELCLACLQGMGDMGKQCHFNTDEFTECPGLRAKERGTF